MVALDPYAKRKGVPKTPNIFDKEKRSPAGVCDVQRLACTYVTMICVVTSNAAKRPFTVMQKESLSGAKVMHPRALEIETLVGALKTIAS